MRTALKPGGWWRSALLGGVVLAVGSCTTESVLRPPAEIGQGPTPYAGEYQTLPTLADAPSLETGYGTGEDPYAPPPALPEAPQYDYDGQAETPPVAPGTFEAQLAALGEPVPGQAAPAAYPETPPSAVPAQTAALPAPPMAGAIPSPGTAGRPADAFPEPAPPVAAPAPVPAPAATPVVRIEPVERPRKRRSLLGGLARIAGLSRPDNPAQSARRRLSPAESQCRRDLKKLKVQFVDVHPIGSGRGCGISTPVKVSSINGTAIQPAATLSCTAARQLAGWTREVLQPAARWKLWSRAAAVKQMSSYSCRNIAGSRTLSEHGKGNALDIGGVVLASGKYVPIEKKGLFALRQKGFQRKIRQGGCRYFSTVLGPGYNRAHADHLHFDVKARRSGSRVCK